MTHPLQPVVLELDSLVQKNGWQPLFEKAVTTARSYGLEETKDITDYKSFLVWMNEVLFWVPVEDFAGKKIYNTLSTFYFILDQPSVITLQNTIKPYPVPPELTTLSAWMVKYAAAWGAFLDTTDSITPESLETFWKSPKFKLQDYMAPPSGYMTFNQLFARHTKPGLRPVASPCDPRVIVSAADSTFVGAWDIAEDSTIEVKGIKWSIGELLVDSPYKDRFIGGVFTHAFLNTTDYHRLHTPVNGVVLESRVILGQVYLDVVVREDPDTHKPALKAIRTIGKEARPTDKDGVALDAQDGTGYQFAQARGLMVIESEFGLVAVLPIGMAQVSSVVMTAEKGVTLRKGEEFSYFQFGGSDHVMLFEKSAGVKVTAVENVHYNQGVAVAEFGA